VRFAYADPPYPGYSAAYYKDHPDFDGEVDHTKLFERLDTYDGWVLHTASVTLEHVMNCAADAGVDGYRIMSWMKTFAAFKPNVPVAYAWEPVLVKAIRKPVVSDRLTLRDWVAERITMQKGLVGVKPEAVCMWAFEVAGAEPTDEFDDLFPGSGAVTAAWHKWRLAVSEGIGDVNGTLFEDE
jgi:hypothetical protein